jgi:hypothetical protein
MDTLLAHLPRRWLLALTLVGLLVPWYFNLQYFLGGGSPLPGPFFREAFANALTTAITLDVYLAAGVFCLAVAADRHGGRRRWWVVPATFCIGLSFALPGYLWWRSRPGAGGHHQPVRRQ